ncbi:MAG: hypothetical protein WAM71_13255 [Candidatus Korobacteraceae bacterium]
MLPESGLLTDDTYTNLYFGFSFHLPMSIHGHRLMLPLSSPGEHALLAMGFQDDRRYGTLEVTAGGNSAEYDQRITPDQAQQREDQIARSKPGAPKSLDYAPAPIKFKRKDKRGGEVHATQYSARIRDYDVRFTVQTNDKAFLDKARQAIEEVKIFCTDDTGRFFTPDGKPYIPRGTATDGPTIPTAVVDEAIGNHPAERTIPPGEVVDGRFRMPQLDFSYALPGGWLPDPRPPAPDDEGAGDTLAERLLDLWNSCARDVLDANSATNSAARLQLRVLDQACLGLPAPASISDSFGSESLGRYLQMLGRFGNIKSNRLVESGGRLFSVYEGTVPAGPPTRNLEQRDAEVIAVTRYGKLLFAWSWSAPTMSELQQSPSSPAQFGTSAPIAVGPAMLTWRTTSRP